MPDTCGGSGRRRRPPAGWDVNSFRVSVFQYCLGEVVLRPSAILLEIVVRSGISILHFYNVANTEANDMRRKGVLPG